jgi:hypothetical protein
MTPKRQRLLYIAAVLIGLAIVAGPILYGRLFPLPTRYASDVEHFKYGSVGVEPAAGIPFEVWRALPAVCMAPDQARLGYRRFGFQWEPGHAAPVGMPLERAIVPRVGINCALCHVGRVETPGGASRLLIGAPNTNLDLQSYLRFLFSCAESSRFTADAIIAEMRRHRRVGMAEALLYRMMIIPQTRSALRDQRRQLAFTDHHPDWLPGRAAGFNPAKVQVLRRPYDGTLDTVDFPALWNMRARQPGGLHWDGLNTSLHEVFLNSGIGNGATARTIDIPSLDRTEAWVMDLRPAPYPFPIDAVLAAQGQRIFASTCADCHAAGGGKVNQPIPQAWVGTDRNRLDSWTDAAMNAFLALDHYSWRYTHFRRTGGYVATPLDGIWARAPYLHNGSVPNLDALLRPPAQRPVLFGRGSARYDPARVGFASDRGRRYDTRLPGNSAQGHLWGTTLAEPERRALLEYLKTL